MRDDIEVYNEGSLIAVRSSIELLLYCWIQHTHHNRSTLKLRANIA